MDNKREILEGCYYRANSCGYHPDCVPWKMADVVEVLHACEDNYRECADTRSACVVELANGNFGTVTEWGDSTGHG
jgi:hypothetical protein